MQEVVVVNNQKIVCQLKKNRRAKHLRISFVSPQELLVTLPMYTTYLAGREFILQNLGWIKQTHKKLSLHHRLTLPKNITLVDLKIRTRELIKEKILHYNKFYNFKYTRVSIKNQKTRWGSCSSSGTLSFNCKLRLLPAHLIDYIVVHELCHLKELNHSKHFWAQVSRLIPNYKKCRDELMLYALI